MTPIISFVGRSGAGKTTLIEKLIKYFTQGGYSIGTIKHTHHSVSFDKEGKDSYRHFQAGATSSMIVSEDKIGFVTRNVVKDTGFLVKNYFGHCDLVIVEGFKDDDTKKIEVYRKEVSEEPLYKRLKNVIAVATNTTFNDISCFSINDIEGIAMFIVEELSIKIRKT